MYVKRSYLAVTQYYMSCIFLRCWATLLNELNIFLKTKNSCPTGIYIMWLSMFSNVIITFLRVSSPLVSFTLTISLSLNLLIDSSSLLMRVSSNLFCPNGKNWDWDWSCDSCEDSIALCVEKSFHTAFKSLYILKRSIPLHRYRRGPPEIWVNLWAMICETNVTTKEFGRAIKAHKL